MGTDFHCFQNTNAQNSTTAQYTHSTRNGMKNHEKEAKWKKEYNYIHLYVSCIIILYRFLCIRSFPIVFVCVCVWLLKFHEGTSQIDLYSEAMKRLTFGRHFKAIVCFMIFIFLLLFSGWMRKKRIEIYEYMRRKKQKRFKQFKRIGQDI